jgi:hypothetical protein
MPGDTQRKDIQPQQGQKNPAAPMVMCGGLPFPTRRVCRIVRQLTSELVVLAGERTLVRSDRRRAACHIRQIAMYVCHVVLGISLSDIGMSFGKDRTTVGYACNVVEDRRDDPGFDEFVSVLERITASVFSKADI